MRRHAFLFICVLFALVEHPRSAPANTGAERDDRMVFTNLTPMGAQVSFDRLLNRGTSGDITSTMKVYGLGQFCDVDMNGRPSNPIFPLGPRFDSSLDISIGPGADGMGTGLLIAGSSGPTNHPMVLFSLETPPVRLGETPFEDIVLGGLRSAIGNVIGDRTPEFIFSSGPGGSGQVFVVEVNRDNTIVFSPYGEGFRGGIYVTTGDIDRDGFADVITSQEEGGELSVYKVLNDLAQEIGRGRPYDHSFNGGVRVAAGDLNNDGVADIVTSPITGPPRIRAFDVSGPTPVTIADFLAFDQERPGGVTVAAGLEHGEPIIVATNGPQLQKFTVNSLRREWTPAVGFEQNPFQRIANVLLGVDVHTPPAPARPQH